MMGIFWVWKYQYSKWILLMLCIHGIRPLTCEPHLLCVSDSAWWIIVGLCYTPIHVGKLFWIFPSIVEWQTPWLCQINLNFYLGPVFGMALAPNLVSACMLPLNCQSCICICQICPIKNVYPFVLERYPVVWQLAEGLEVEVLGLIMDRMIIISTPSQCFTSNCLNLSSGLRCYFCINYLLITSSWKF